eukprot:7382070-Prymnesium_polylepis.1
MVERRSSVQARREEELQDRGWLRRPEIGLLEHCVIDAALTWSSLRYVQIWTFCANKWSDPRNAATQDVGRAVRPEELEVTTKPVSEE